MGSTPLSYDSTYCEYFVASPRHEGLDLESLVSGATVNLGFTRISPERATSTNALDLSWWRGAIGLIGTVQKI
jgi:hypothetical protein